MEITLYTDRIIDDIERISRDESASIADAMLRYTVEVGTENREEVVSELMFAVASLKRVMHRVLKKAVVSELEQKNADNVLPAVPDNIFFDLQMSERRAANKAVVLADKMHEFLVCLTLSRHYANVGQTDKSNARSMRAIEIGNEIDELIYTKEPPIV